jgi:hypothetical protein
MTLLLSKQVFPLTMRDAELRVESWWQNEIGSLPADTATAILLLSRSTVAQFSKAWIGLDPNNPARFHAIARSCLFALQAALESLKGELPPGEFPSTCPPLIRFQHTEAILLNALQYARVRDVYLTFKWGGYSLDASGKNVLRFRDVAAWRGVRDDACRRISEQIDEEKISSEMARITPAGLLDSQYDGPATLTFPKVTVAEFIRAWDALKEEFSRDVLTGEPTIASLGQLSAIL